MDNALQSLTNTLQAINSRQAAARKRARRGINTTPFTAAVLNREKLDILTYIRDADQLEASLFWYPPLPQSSVQSHHKSTQSAPGPSAYPGAARNHNTGSSINSATVSDENKETSHLLAPRLPEPRHIAPPTPLRRTQTAAASEYAQGDDTPLDARVLLLAAQRLNDTYRSAPRARKHIKGLIKKHDALSATIRQYEVLIRENDRRLRAGNASRTPDAHGLSSTTADLRETSEADDQDELKAREELLKIQDTIQKEELEILALEEMISELKQAQITLEAQRQEQEQQRHDEEMYVPQDASEQTFSTPEFDETLRRRPSHIDTAESELVVLPDDKTQAQTQPSAQQDETILRDEVVSYAQQPSLHHFVEGGDNIEGSRDHPKEPSGILSEDISIGHVGQVGMTAIDRDADRDVFADGDETVGHDEQHQSELVPSAHEPEQNVPVVEFPNSSEELERVTIKVWNVFGDALRLAAPEREMADFHATLEILHNLMSGADRSHPGDYSTGSAQTASTQATLMSEASAGVSSQLTPEILMTAFVISQMLRSPEPHRMNIDDLKVRGHEWWTQSGMQVWLHSRAPEEAGLPSQVEAFEDGQNLARKATYGMISKQLFAIKRQKGVGLVGFA
ncbi:hypothetical protein BCV70DRAFT_202233 [Testicularia cyperi]|uniref:Uncharacterized protein n=1 Tax=Testicularia cyperi TaxID=1882483 RepID=A0A317XJS7_9BASI|nr:hypothetical protein BCV70DRAFT_202233 [Testicularia cyperi]